MKRFFAIIIICISFYACKPGIPKDVIQPDKMENVLYDIHAVDGYITTIQKPDTAKIIASSYYKGVYKKFNIDSSMYARSLDYYFKRPDLLNTMFENIMKKFELERKRNDKRVDAEVLALQKKEQAKNSKPLFYETKAPTPYTMLANPFTYVTTAF